VVGVSAADLARGRVVDVDAEDLVRSNVEPTSQFCGAIVLETQYGSSSESGGGGGTTP